MMMMSMNEYGDELEATGERLSSSKLVFYVIWRHGT